MAMLVNVTFFPFPFQTPLFHYSIIKLEDRLLLETCQLLQGLSGF